VRLFIRALWFFCLLAQPVFFAGCFVPNHDEDLAAPESGTRSLELNGAAMLAGVSATEPESVEPPGSGGFALVKVDVGRVAVAVVTGNDMLLYRKTPQRPEWEKLLLASPVDEADFEIATDGRLQAVYVHSTTGALWYGALENAAWTARNISERPGTIHSHVDLALDANGAAHTIFFRRIGEAGAYRHYATNAGGSWSYEEVDWGNLCYSVPGPLFVDADRSPAFLCFHGTPYGGLYPWDNMTYLASRTAGGWGLTAIARVSCYRTLNYWSIGWYGLGRLRHSTNGTAAFVLDYLNQFRYLDPPMATDYYRLYLFSRNAEKDIWSRELLQEEDGIYDSLDLEPGDDNVIHVAFTVYHALWLGQYDAGVWSSAPVPGVSCDAADLRLDEAGAHHLVCRDDDAGQLLYVNDVSGEWVVERVRPSADLPANPH
jgi:hypothetical protein